MKGNSKFGGPALRRMWAPWRAQYVCAAGGQGGTGRRNCLFCRLWRERDDVGNLILWRGERCFLMLNRFPYNNGHLMVVPVRHVATAERLTDAEGEEMLALLRQALAALRRSFAPDGFNLGVNIGRTAGAGVVGHVHLHVVPRYNGDTNFMPVVAETKVVSEHLAETYRRLAGFFAGGRERK